MYVFMTLSPLFDDELHESEEKSSDLVYEDIGCEMQQPCRRHWQDVRQAPMFDH